MSWNIHYDGLSPLFWVHVSPKLLAFRVFYKYSLSKLIQAKQNCKYQQCEFVQRKNEKSLIQIKIAKFKKVVQKMI